MIRSPLPLVLLLPVLGLVACGSDDVVPPTDDAGPLDMGMEAPPDSGVVAKCPLMANDPSCVALDDPNQGCLPPATELSTNNSCGDFCPGWYAERCVGGSCPVVCATGQCVQASVIGQDEPLNLNMPIGEARDATFFVRVVVHGTTSGGETFSCEDDVMPNPTTFFQDPCYNVTDVRTSNATRFGDVYRFTFSAVPESTRMIFVVYGFRTDDTSEAPIGISCTEIDVPRPGRAGARLRTSTPTR